MSAIPAARRRLVTDHDALGYFAARYDIEVIGTVIPALSTQAQASAGEVARLVRTIRSTRRDDDLPRELGQREAHARRSPATRARQVGPGALRRLARAGGQPGRDVPRRAALQRARAGRRASTGARAAPRAVSCRRPRPSGTAAGRSARRRCTSPAPLHSSKCRWQPRASPVSPTLPIGWPVSTRAPLASGDGSLQVHVDVVDVGAVAVDDDVVAGRALGAVELHDAAARGDERRAAAREDVVALVAVTVAPRAEGGLPGAVGVASAHGEDVVDEVESRRRPAARAPGRRTAPAPATRRRRRGTRSGRPAAGRPPTRPSQVIELTRLGRRARPASRDDRAVGDADERDGHGHRLAREQVDAGRARRVVVDAAPDDPDVERGRARRAALRPMTTARLGRRARAVVVDGAQATAGAPSRARRRRRSCGAPCARATVTLSS